jgi:hypothetical protein
MPVMTAAFLRARGGFECNAAPGAGSNFLVPEREGGGETLFLDRSVTRTFHKGRVFLGASERKVVKLCCTSSFSHVPALVCSAKVKLLVCSAKVTRPKWTRRDHCSPAGVPCNCTHRTTALYNLVAPSRRAGSKCWQQQQQHCHARLWSYRPAPRIAPNFRCTETPSSNCFRLNILIFPW